jgi:antitoxin MazE
VETAIRNIGNSKGLVIPKPLLAKAGMEGESTVLIQVENGSIVLSKSSKPLRDGWAVAAAVIAEQGEDELLMGEFANADDAELRW